MPTRYLAHLAGDISSSFTTIEKIWFTVGSLICFIAWYLLHTAVGLPAYPGYSAGLLVDQPGIALFIVFVGTPVFTLLASLLVGRVRFEAGLFCCLIGLVTLPAHGGTMQNALLLAPPSSVYPRMMLESTLLCAVILAAYLLLTRLAGTRLVAEPAIAPSDDPDTLGDRLTAVAMQAVVMLVLMTFICLSTNKGQAMAAVCVAGLVSSLMIHQMYVVRGSVWYVAGTMLASVVAYFYTGIFSPDGAQIGDVRGLFAGAARALPLHYATLGCAGAILGYWTSVVWHAAKKMKELDNAKTA